MSIFLCGRRNGWGAEQHPVRVCPRCVSRAGRDEPDSDLHQHQHSDTSDNFSTNAKRKTVLKIAQTGLGLAKNLLLPSRQVEDFLEGLSHQHVRKLQVWLDRSADKATDCQWINCWMLDFFSPFFFTLCYWGQWCCHGDGTANYRCWFSFYNCSLFNY